MLYRERRRTEELRRCTQFPVRDRILDYLEFGKERYRVGTTAVAAGSTARESGICQADRRSWGGGSCLLTLRRGSRLPPSARREAQPEQEDQAVVPADEDAFVSTWVKRRRRSWARLLRRIYEVGPLCCPCGGDLRIVSVITDRVVVDRILTHRKAKQLQSPFAARAPPAA